MLTTLLIAAGESAPQNQFGIQEAIKQGGLITIAIITVLGIMSVGSFYILITKWIEQQKILNQYKEVRSGFWKAPTLRDGATKLDQNSAWRQLVDDANRARDSYGKMGDDLEAHDWLHGSLARSEASINSRLSGGLPFLATVGATAPFVGLLGTVIGIYRSLISISLAGSASIDKVAGPVGEALIMTAFGLLVAVPAVLAYNWLQSRNKRIAELLTGFSTDLLAYITSNGEVKPAAVTTTSAGKTPATGKTATTARPAGSTTVKAATAGNGKPTASTTTTGTTTTGTTTGSTTVKK